jgi:hypothetical protein
LFKTFLDVLSNLPYITEVRNEKTDFFDTPFTIFEEKKFSTPKGKHFENLGSTKMEETAQYFEKWLLQTGLRFLPPTI